MKLTLNSVGYPFAAFLGFLGMSMALLGCNRSGVEPTPPVITIEGCQYFKLDSYSTGRSYYTLVHKGNCTNHQ